MTAAINKSGWDVSRKGTDCQPLQVPLPLGQHLFSLVATIKKVYEFVKSGQGCTGGLSRHCPRPEGSHFDFSKC